MVTSTHAPTFVRGLPWVALGLALIGLLFRSLIWASWRPYPGDPYGVADILEGLILLTIVGLCALSILAGLVVALLPRWRSPQLAARLFLAGFIVPVAYYFVHPHVPTFRLWG